MSDRPIQVGDFVVVVRGHACTIGMIATVRKIVTCTGDGICKDCGDTLCGVEGEPIAILDTSRKIQTYRLKRIPPLEELEGQRTEESIKEPAK